MKISLVTTLPSLVENQRLKEEAKKLGHHFQLVDLKNFNFQIEKNHLQILNMLALKTDLIIVRGIFTSVKTIVAIINHLRRKGIRVFDNNFLLHKYSINKVADLVKLSLAGLPVPNSAFSQNYNDYQKIAKKLGYPLVIKSTRMGKGVNVFKIEAEKDLLEFIDQCQEDGRPAKNWLLQEFIPYQYDLRILIIGKRFFTMRRIPAKGEFRANFSLGGRVETFEVDQDGKKLAFQAIESVEREIAGVDMLITKNDQRYLLEVNHTAGFIGMEKATKENIARLFIQHAIENAK